MTEREPDVSQPKKSKIDIQSLPARYYLDQTVVPILLQGLAYINKERPQDPIGALANFLLKNKSNYDPAVNNNVVTTSTTPVVTTTTPVTVTTTPQEVAPAVTVAVPAAPVSDSVPGFGSGAGCWRTITTETNFGTSGCNGSSWDRNWSTDGRTGCRYAYDGLEFEFEFEFEPNFKWNRSD